MAKSKKPKVKQPEPIADLSGPDALRRVFEPSRVDYALRRMGQTQEGENSVAHPLRRLLVREYRDELSQMISRIAIRCWPASPTLQVQQVYGPLQPPRPRTRPRLHHSWKTATGTESAASRAWTLG